ncbi:DUF1206 domain-containing protein [Euzebya sp.]|uniref:DUF1206 domain-containing protein n=1 Tax=Euzebya sp. TaxID=1971409 RepID=UPI003511560C
MAQTSPTVPSSTTSSASVGDQAQQAANSPWVDRLGRMGFAAKGVLYLTIAAIAGSVGLGGGESEASQTGAIEQLSEQSYGTVILIVLAVGLAGYALLRLVHVVANPSGESGAKGVVMRISYLVRALIYGGLTVYAVRVLVGSGGGSGGESSSEQQLTQRVLELPYGQWLVGGAAAVLAGVAAYQLKKAVTREFMDQVRAHGFRRTVASWSGSIGHAARAVLFGTIAVLLAQAAVQSDSSESGGLSAAFGELSSTAFGTGLLTAVAVGVAGYGVFCLAMAAWGTPRTAE